MLRKKLVTSHRRRRKSESDNRESSYRIQSNLARPERFELPTRGFEGRCSIQLSYGRKSREPSFEN